MTADVLRLISEGQIKYLRRCGNPTCLFIFTDRSGRRKWCSMRRCGNRANGVKHLKRRTHSEP
ncbi:CGNR zinc finger domain-containing protein [Effusibacillus pohliae]|uniref:CGNR zinc finger domain-containing protein n=1 Tax=Effusibacillus pohliae TaxID=232270 RepID=UPI003899297B